MKSSVTVPLSPEMAADLRAWSTTITEVVYGDSRLHDYGTMIESRMGARAMVIDTEHVLCFRHRAIEKRPTKAGWTVIEDTAE